jgi:hypothetical protein
MLLAVGNRKLWHFHGLLSYRLMRAGQLLHMCQEVQRDMHTERHPSLITIINLPCMNGLLQTNPSIFQAYSSSVLLFYHTLGHSVRALPFSVFFPVFSKALFKTVITSSFLSCWRGWNCSPSYETHFILYLYSLIRPPYGPCFNLVW